MAVFSLLNSVILISIISNFDVDTETELCRLYQCVYDVFINLFVYIFNCCCVTK